MEGESSRSKPNVLKEIVIAWLEAKLREKGFEVKRNAVVEGAGVRHSIDLLAEMTPLPDVRLSIGVMVFDRPIALSDVEMFLGWKEEIPFLTKLVLVPLSEIDSQAHALALKYGIDIVIPPEDILSGTSLAKVALKEVKICKHLEPLIDAETIVKKVKDKLKPSFFRRSKAKLEKVVLIFVPLIESRIEMAKIESLSGEVEVIEGKTLFDAIAGYAVRVRDGTLDVYEDYGSFTEIPVEALEVLRVLSEELSMELGALAGRTGMEVDKLKPILEVLASRGLIDLYGDLVEFKGLNLEMFANIDAIIERIGIKAHEGEPSVNDARIKLDIRIPIPKLEDLLSSLRAKVLESKIVYYPFYAALVVETKNGTIHEKLMVYDGVSGEEVEGFTKILAMPELIDTIRSMKGFSFTEEE